jgi:hypothetical protein
MTRKIYRTAQGRMVDLGALQLKNESVRAVGNMSVNARGDMLDADNRPIATRNNQVARQYGRQVSNVSDDPVLSKKMNPNATAPARRAAVEIPAPPEDFDDEFEKSEDTDQTVADAEPVNAEPATGGLAAAIARAREVVQEPLKDPRRQTPSGKINRV